MSDLLKKGFFLGLGAAISGKEKLEKLLDELVKKGEVSPSQAKEMLQGFIEKGEAKNTDWGDQTKGYFKKTLSDLGFVAKEDFQKLEERVAKLEEKHNQE